MRKLTKLKQMSGVSKAVPHKDRNQRCISVPLSAYEKLKILAKLDSRTLGGQLEVMCDSFIRVYEKKKQAAKEEKAAKKGENNGKKIKKTRTETEE